MISFERDGGSFNYRVAGVAVHDGRVLLHRAAHEEFWTLPGGRCELLEPSAEALRREMREELGEDVAVERLLWVVENFFHYNDARCHEIGLYYLMRFTGVPPGIDGEPWLSHEEGITLIFRWFPLEALARLAIRPSFLEERLRQLPDAIAHVVHQGEEPVRER